MKKSIITILSVVLGLSLFAAACNHSDDSSSPATTAGSGGSSTPTNFQDDSDFGNLEWPCGEGTASGATDQGVTDDKITIGGGNDRGFPTSAGLNKEQTEAVIAFVAECNRRGGINGRLIDHINYDAGIFNVDMRIQEACEQVFMLVGSGFALDSLGEATRVGCGLPAVPAWAVGADFAHGPDQITGVPNPSDQQTMSLASMFANGVIEGHENVDLGRSAGFYGNFAATQETWQKIKIAFPARFSQYNFIVDREFSILGEEDWTPWVKELIDNDIEHVHYVGSCLPHYQALRLEGVANELDTDIVWTLEANFYEDKCAAANGDGAMNNSYLRMSFIPFEEADYNKATRQFLEIVRGGGYDATLLGMQATSSFLLWATAARDCGSNLTRQCVLDNLNQVTSWNGHGMHVETNPAGNEAANCGMIVQLQNTEYIRVYPEEKGTFSCPTDSEFNEGDWRQAITTTAVEAALLDANRISQKHLG